MLNLKTAIVVMQIQISSEFIHYSSWSNNSFEYGQHLHHGLGPCDDCYIIPLSKSGKNMAAHTINATRRPTNDMFSKTFHPFLTCWLRTAYVLDDVTSICKSTKDRLSTKTFLQVLSRISRDLVLWISTTWWTRETGHYTQLLTGSTLKRMITCRLKCVWNLL